MKLTSFVKGGGKLEEPSSSTPLLDHLTEPSWREALSVHSPAHSLEAISSGPPFLLKAEFEKAYFKDIEEFLAKEAAAGKEVFPPRHLIFNAFNATPIQNIRVVILGQDPYHDVGQVNRSLAPPLPHSNMPLFQTGSWALLLRPARREASAEPQEHLQGARGGHQRLRRPRTRLPPGLGRARRLPPQRHAHRPVRALPLPDASVVKGEGGCRAHKANSHAKIGWQRLTDAAMEAVSAAVPHAVFILWGGFAHKKEPLIDAAKHTIIKVISTFFLSMCHKGNHWLDSRPPIRPPFPSPSSWAPSASPKRTPPSPPTAWRKWTGLSDTGSHD